MKHIKYILPTLALGGLLYVYAGNINEKIKPVQPTPPPAEQYTLPSTPIRLSGTTDCVPYGLSLTGVDDKQVSFRWNNPEAMNGYFDDFEGHPDFVINSPGSIGWDYLDMDNEYTYTWAATTFPNQGQKMAYIIMNPSKTSLAVTDYPGIQPYSGNKVLLAFTVDGGNNDFIISPELNFTEEFQISFRAKSYNDSYGLERIRVGYSTSGKLASDFIFVSQNDYEEVPTEWTLFQYQIPREAKYVTINCVSQEAFMLLIDDIFIGTNTVRPKSQSEQYITGFNIYRNNVKINSDVVTELFYTDDVPDYGDYTYTVTSVYADGSETAQSEPLSVNVPDIRLLPFEDHFDGWIIDADNWETPADDAGNASQWSCDYYTYGLANPSATYRFSNIDNYSHSLISRELRSINPEKVYLRFKLRHLNYNSVVGDTLSVEVSCDDGTNWQNIAMFDNSEGTFEPRIEQFNLGEILNNELFRIRFRAHGANAYYIDYWYVDDIKVWEPEWTNAQLTVQSQGMPVANCLVTMIADHGAELYLTTDENGQIDLAQIEKGNYTITIEHEGCNLYEAQWTITGDGNNTFTANISSPKLTVDAEAIHVDLRAEEKATKELKLKNEGDGPLHYTIEAAYDANSSNIEDRWNIQKSFDASGDLQTSVVFDGEYYYTASWYYMGTYYKYDADGNFLEEFTIPGMYYKMYDLAFDGTYFYGSDNTNVIFQLDFKNKRIVNKITIASEPDLKITHCAYDTRNDQFWVGGFYTLGRVDRDGNVTVSFRDISTDVEMAVYGSAFDNVTPGGPYLWFGNEVVSGNNVIDKVLISQYNLNTRQVTTVEHHVGDIPGYQIGIVGAPNYICGIETSTHIVDGTLSLVGILQQSPSRIFVYKLCDVMSWLTFEPKTGSLESGEEKSITINFDARNGVVGNTYETTLDLYSLPGTEKKSLPISYTVTAASETPRPTNLTATIEGDAHVVLTWENGSSDLSPIGYNIYRNGTKITETPVTTMQYRDENVAHGDYCYTVTAIYNEDKESIQSDEIQIYMKIGAPYFAPTGLSHTVTSNKMVSLSWQSPTEMQQTATTLRWDNGVNSDAIGMSEGGYFWAGMAWEYADLIEYRGMILDEVQLFIQEQYTSLTLQVYKDDQRVVSQNIRSEVEFGAFNTFTLTNPVTIEPGYDYKVVFLVSHQSGMRPIGVDNTVAVNGKGNIFSTDGKEWYPATYLGIGNNNFNMAIHLSPSTSDEEMPSGYNIYRDGTRVNDTLVTEMGYHEELSTPGSYMYQVSSVYNNNGESPLSDATQVEIINLGTPVAPTNVNAEVEYNRTIRLRWDFPLEQGSTFPVDIENTYVTCREGYPEYVSMFRGYIPGEMGIASDGEYIYTSMHNSNGTINKYTLDGEFVESFIISNTMVGIRNLTFDGSHFYAADSESSCIYQLDMENKTVTDTISISEIALHVTYIPDLDNGRGGFEVGDWETSIYVSKRGAKLGNGPSYVGAAGTAYYNGILYAFEQGRDSRYTLCSYDFATGEEIACIDIGEYVEINPETNASAGGMSVINTRDGLTLLAMVLQEPSNSRFIFFDLGSIPGLDGYNIYRNGEKRNDKPLKFRSFTEDESVPGEYNYEIETVYIDGSTSGKSPVASVEIYDADVCDAPIDVKGKQTSYGYDVVISYVDATAMLTDTYESAEEGTVGEAFTQTGWTNTNNTWSVTDTDAYEGMNSLLSDAENSGYLIIPVGNYDSNFVFSFTARNSDDHNGNGRIRILTSTGSQLVSDFIPLQYVTTTEAWKKYSFSLPAGTKYIALSTDKGVAAQYVDAISINSEEVGQIYGYDIFRDGEQLNESPVTEISYTDHNLLPGTYTYQVRAYYVNSCISDLTEAITVNVDYSNNCQRPGHLYVENSDEGRLLTWSAPALGDAINLKWHSGNAYDAAGMPSGGCYFAGVEWSAEELSQYSSLSLSEVEFYINQIPDALFILVYKGNELIAQQYVPELQQYSFNTVALDNPIHIDSSKSMRVAIYVEHNEISVPLGYDEGPAKTGKGDLYSSDGVTWSTLTSNSIDGNWNITLGLRAYADNSSVNTNPSSQKVAQVFTPRIKVNALGNNTLRSVPLAQPTSSTRNTFEGYNVYCNSQCLNDMPLQTTQYLDSENHFGHYYEYQVTAIYSGCGEVGSNVVRFEVSGLENNLTNTVRFYYKEGSIIAEGLQQSTPVILFDASGKIVHSGMTFEPAPYIIDASGMPEGVYLIYAGRYCEKILVKK